MYDTVRIVWEDTVGVVCVIQSGLCVILSGLYG